MLSVGSRCLEANESRTRSHLMRHENSENDSDKAGAIKLSGKWLRISSNRQMDSNYITITDDNIASNCEREETWCTKNLPPLITLELCFSKMKLFGRDSMLFSRIFPILQKLHDSPKTLDGWWTWAEFFRFVNLFAELGRFNLHYFRLNLWFPNCFQGLLCNLA